MLPAMKETVSICFWSEAPLSRAWPLIMLAACSIPEFAGCGCRAGVCAAAGVAASKARHNAPAASGADLTGMAAAKRVMSDPPEAREVRRPFAVSISLNAFATVTAHLPRARPNPVPDLGRQVQQRATIEQ